MSPLTSAELELVAATQALIDACSDHEVHTVGAAAVDDEGQVFSGVNVFHFTGAPCAELVVLGIAAAQGAGRLVTMVAVGNRGRGPIPPCGRCRQVLFDYHPGVRVLLPTEDGVRGVRIEDLLPFAYRWDPDPTTTPGPPPR